MDCGNFSKRTVEAPSEGENSAKRLNVSIGVENLDCPICFEPLRPPIFQCSVGHCICSSCHGKQLDKKCHLCSVKTSFNRCFGMEHIIQSVIVPCSNAKYGCTEKVTYYQKEEHEKACQNAPCFCPESGCGFAGRTMVLLDHLTTQHKCPLTALPDSYAASLRLQPGLNVLRCTETSYFFLFSMASEPFGHAISVVCVQPSVTEPNFTCNMKYDCRMTSYCESTSCNIRSSSLSDGLPTGHDLIIPKGKISDDRKGIMLTAKIHQPLSISISRLLRGLPLPWLRPFPSRRWFDASVVEASEPPPVSPANTVEISSAEGGQETARFLITPTKSSSHDVNSATAASLSAEQRREKERRSKSNADRPAKIRREDCPLLEATGDSSKTAEERAKEKCKPLDAVVQEISAPFSRAPRSKALPAEAARKSARSVGLTEGSVADRAIRLTAEKTSSAVESQRQGKGQGGAGVDEKRTKGSVRLHGAK